MNRDARTRVLASIEWFTPAFQAGGIISSLVNQVEHLSHALDFRIVCSNRDLVGQEPMSPNPGQWQQFERYRVMHTQPLVPWQVILEQVQPDIIYINGLFNKPFCRDLLSISRDYGCPVVLASHGMLAPNALSIKPVRKYAWLTLQRLMGTMEALRWHASSEAESMQIKNWFPTADIRVAQNLPPAIGEVRHDPGTSLEFLSVGRIHPIKNYVFAAKCLKQLAQSAQVDITYRIIGPIENTEEAHRISDHDDPRFNTEFVGVISPADLAEHYQKSRALLVPSLSENFGQVVVEALSNGLPVVVSEHTPWGQFPSTASIQCLALDMELWLSAMHPLLNLDHRRSLTDEAQSYFAEHLLSDRIRNQHIAMLTP